LAVVCVAHTSKVGAAATTLMFDFSRSLTKRIYKSWKSKFEKN
jgi:hypothetical protein